MFIISFFVEICELCIVREVIKIQFSKRIFAISSEVGYKTLADIGTDHAYIPIQCFLSKDMRRAIACDINKSPLSRAKSNIEQYNLSDKIETRLCNGLQGLRKNEVDSVTIGGMGGILIIEILENGLEIVNSLKQLIIQPQQNVDKVRKYIHSINLKIVNEKMIIEDNKFYNIITCENTEYPQSNYTEIDYLFGKLLIDEKNDILKQFVKLKLEKMLKIKNQIGKNSKSEYNNTLQKMYEEVLNCL